MTVGLSSKKQTLLHHQYVIINVIVTILPTRNVFVWCLYFVCIVHLRMFIVRARIVRACIYACLYLCVRVFVRVCVVRVCVVRACM